ncbi:MAG: hypothetical protein KAR79_03620 [Simkaniaceae bacterium]|nr:hypothetical protein [Simkaniaceae bacterium]
MSGLINDVTENILYFTGEPWRTCLVCRGWNGLQKRLINTALFQISEFYTSHRDPLNIRQILDDTSTPSKKLENIFLKLNKATDSSALALPHASSEKHHARIKEIELHDLMTFWRFLPNAETYFSLPEHQDLTNAEHAINFQDWLNSQLPIKGIVSCKPHYELYAKRIPHEISFLSELKMLGVHISALETLPESIYSLPSIRSIRVLDETEKYQIPHLSLLKIRTLEHISFEHTRIFRKALAIQAMETLAGNNHPVGVKFNSLNTHQKILSWIINLSKLEANFGRLPEILTNDPSPLLAKVCMHQLDDIELFDQTLEEIQGGMHEELLNSLIILSLFSNF